MKELWIFILVLAIPGSALSQPVPARSGAASLQELFDRPLIIGASISADLKAESPALRIARDLGTSGRVVKDARPGAYGGVIVQELKDAWLDHASIIVGVDLFFWDSTKEDCRDGTAAVDFLFAKIRPRGTPIVIGNVPPMPGRWYDSFLSIPTMTACRGVMNGKIKAACGAYPGCSLLDLDALYAEIQSPSGAELAGRRYFAGQLFADGRHPNALGSELIAQRIRALLTASPPK